MPGRAWLHLCAAFRDNRLSSDQRRYARNAAILAAAPDLGIGAPTIGWLASAFAAMRALAQPSIPRKITTPLLIVASGADRVVTTISAEFRLAAKTGDAIIVKGARHELLMEADLYREQALAALQPSSRAATGRDSRPDGLSRRLSAFPAKRFAEAAAPAANGVRTRARRAGESANGRLR